LVGKPEGKGTLGRPILSVDGITSHLRSRWVLKKWDWRGGAWTGLIWVRTGTGGGHLCKPK